MDHREAGKLWEANAEAWTALARAGYDVCRDLYNTPTFLRILPPIDRLAGLDIGCGEGHNTRLLAARGARMSAIDIAETFIRHARASEEQRPLGIQYQVASALELPFGDEQFDFATAFMSFQDMPRQETAFREAWRVLKPGGFLQFSIIHPCFTAVANGWVTDESGRRTALKVANYFDRDQYQIEEWTFSSAPEEVAKRYPKFRIANFDRTLGEWLNIVLSAGFQLEEFAEPAPSKGDLQRDPRQYAARIVPWFLIVRGRKPLAFPSQSNQADHPDP